MSATATDDWRVEADRLRAEGLSVRQIAARVGMGHAVVGEHLKPHYCACGNRRVHNSLRCAECRRADEQWAIDRRVEIVAGMFNDGWTYREMAAVLGRGDYNAATGPELHEARQRGLIGYRYSDYAVRAAA